MYTRQTVFYTERHLKVYSLCSCTQRQYAVFAIEHYMSHPRNFTIDKGKQLHIEQQLYTP